MGGLRGVKRPFSSPKNFSYSKRISSDAISHLSGGKSFSRVLEFTNHIDMQFTILCFKPELNFVELFICLFH
jgi:hypothetical protein